MGMKRLDLGFYALATLAANCLLALSLSSPAFAQSYTASLEGIVTDPTGAVIPGAKVTLTNEATNVTRTATTDALGHYFFTFLPPASYKLNVESAGFTTFERTGMILQVQQAVRVDVQLKPGAVTTKIQVTGEAPRLDNVNATEGRVVNNASMLDLPISAQSRNPTAFAQLVPGVVPVGGYESGGGVNFSANGGRLDITDVLLDGVSVTTQEHNSGIQGAQYYPTVESVQEFKVQTNSFSAEYGNSAGTVINMVTRSGTNQLHGDVFEFNQISALKANNFFTNRAGGKVGRFVYNQFGGVAGGPVYIPKVYDGRDKTFFFVHHERKKVPGSPIENFSTVPTAAERQGDFSQSFYGDGTPVTIYDPTTVHQDASGTWVRDPFPGNVIPPEKWSSVAKTAIPFYPNPTSDGTGPAHVNNYHAQGTNTSSWYEQEIKIDHNFTENQRLSARYSRDYSIGQDQTNLWGSCPSTAASLPYCGGSRGNFMFNGPGYGSNKSQSGTVDYTNTITPTTVLNLRWGVMRQNSPSGIVGEKPYFNEHDLGFQNTVSMQVQRAPSFGLQDYSQLGPSIWTGSVNASDVNSFIGALTKVRGRHTFKMGADLRFQRLNYAQPPVNTASFVFCDAETGQKPLAPAADQGNALASFIVGWGSTSGCTYASGQSFNPVSLVASRTYGFYGQDDFRITPRLTLNLGLRYEVPFPATERHNRFNWFDLNAPSPIQAGVTAFMAANPNPDPTDPSATWATVCPACSHLTGGYVYASSSQRRAFDTDWSDWAPRFGFAYQFRPHMVVRGGYGIYYGLSSAQNTGELADGFTASTGYSPSKDGGITQYASIDNPFPNGIVQPTGSALGLMQSIGYEPYGPVRNIAPTPRIQQWSLSVERELPGNSLFELAYSASKGNRLGYGTIRQWPTFCPAQYLSLGDHLFDQLPNPFNAFVPATADLTGPTISRFYLLQPHPEFSYISPRPGPPWGNSLYHSGYVKFTKRMSQGLQLMASYTYSKLISDSDSADDPNVDWLAGAIQANGGGRARTQDWANFSVGDRSVSLLDIRHRFVADFIYQLPIGRGKAFGKNWSRALDAIAGGWQVNGFVTFAPGVPLIPHLANRSFLETGVRQRPNLFCNPKTYGPIESRLDNFLIPNCFGQPAPYTFGTAPRTMDYARAPGFHGADMSVFKHIYFSEERTRYLELRVEAFNVTNTPVFGVPGTTWGAGDFGIIGYQVSSPRQVQLGGKIYF